MSEIGDREKFIGGHVPAHLVRVAADLERLSALVGDDIGSWLANPFLSPDLRAEKVAWWIDRAVEASIAKAAVPLAEKVRELHRPWYDVGGVRHDHTVMLDFNALPADHVCRPKGPGLWDWCIPDMDEHYALACYECRTTTHDVESGYLLWPCATIQLLGPPSPSEESRIQAADRRNGDSR